MDNRAECPVCRRRITIDEQRYLRVHNKRATLRKHQEPETCPGSLRQPADQLELGQVPQAGEERG